MVKVSPFPLGNGTITLCAATTICTSCSMTARIGGADLSMTQRKLEFGERPEFTGWTCSNCNWIFQSPDIKADNWDDLMRKAEALRDAAFASHACRDFQESRTAKP